jgi:Rhs element Vgr protein
VPTNDSSIPTPATPDVCTVVVLTDGEQVPGQYHIVSVAVSKELNRIPTATIYIRDGEAARATFPAGNTDLFIPGRQVEIQLGYRSQNDTVFKGLIVKHSIKVRKNGSWLIVECRDEAAKLTSSRKNRYFTDKKDSDIMEEIIGAYGLDNDVEATDPDLKEVVQYNATDWDFLLCRAEANGQVVAVNDGKISIAKPATGASPILKVQYGATVLELDAELDARIQSKGLKAWSWNASDQELIEAEASEPTAPALGNLSIEDLAGVIHADTDEIRHEGKLSQAELQAWADARLLKERLAKVRGRAKFQGFAAVLPGSIIELAGVGDRFEGMIYVSGVRHTVAAGNWETDVQLGMNPTPFAETFNLRPLPAAGLLPGTAGLQTGVVTALENDPEGEDRIKVRLPLVSASEEGTWARLATLDAGQERGTFFRPEIGDEVVVGFLADDPRHPVVLGMLHSSAKPAPEPATDNNDTKGYVSRAKMRLHFDDDKKIMQWETPAGNKMVLSEDETSILIQDQNGNKILLDDSGITIESTGDLILKASGDISMEGANVDIAAQLALTAAGTSSAEISGANMTVKGSASTVIQGGMVQIN